MGEQERAGACGDSYSLLKFPIALRRLKESSLLIIKQNVGRGPQCAGLCKGSDVDLGLSPGDDFGPVSGRAERL